MASACCPQKKSSPPENNPFPDFFFSDGYFVRSLNERQQSAACRLDELGLVSSKPIDYVLCANPEAGDPDMNEVWDSSCNGEIPLTETDREEPQCPSCGRFVHLSGKHKYTGWRIGLNRENCIRYIMEKLGDVSVGAMEIATGVFRCTIGGNEITVCIWDWCDPVRFRSTGFSLSNPCLYIVVDVRKWSGRINVAFFHFPFKELVTGGSGRLLEMLIAAYGRFTESLTVGANDRPLVMVSDVSSVASGVGEAVPVAAMGKLVLESHPGGPASNGFFARLCGQLLKDPRPIGIRQFFFLYHIFVEGVDRRCDGICCTVVSESDLVKRFLDWAGRGYIRYGSRGHAAEPPEYRVQKMWGQCVRQVEKIPGLKGFLFWYRDTEGKKHFGIKLRSEELGCRIRDLEKLLESGKK